MGSHKREEATANDRGWKSGVLTEQELEQELEQRARWPKIKQNKFSIAIIVVFK